MKLTKLFVGAFALSAMLVACGDDSASAKDTDQPDVVYSDVVVETFDNLPACSDNRDGSIAYVKDEKTTYICTDGSWVPEEETSSSSIASTSSSSWQALSSTTRNDCSSSSSEATQSSSSGGTETASSDVETIYDLGRCTADREGEIVYVRDKKAEYLCHKLDWIVISDENPESSSSTTRNDNSSSSSVLANSSSSAIANEAKQSSSSEATQSSSSETTQSSSSETMQSSSSETSAASSSSENISAGSVYDATAKTLKDLRNGKTYKTVTIGDQTWMAENLNYAYTGVPYNYSGYTSDSTSWCYDNDPANCAKYGRLYTWAAAMDSVGKWSTNGKGCGYTNTCSPTYPVRGICPEGWHLPSKTEFEALITAVGGQLTAGKVLKSQTGWTADDGITNEDSFGFSALPAGYRSYTGDYNFEGYYAIFWSTTEHTSKYAYNIYLHYDGDYAGLINNGKVYGRSVRCVKD